MTTNSIVHDLSVAETREVLKKQFVTFSGDRYAEGWADLWNQDFLPWDRKAPSPALADTLINGTHILGAAMLDDGDTKRRKRALVPGCGRGPDVLLLESFGYDVVGLEISPKAVEEAEKFGKDNEGQYAVHDAKVGRGSRKYILGDFYKDDWLEKIGFSKADKFDLIYDYTVSLNATLQDLPN